MRIIPASARPGGDSSLILRSGAALLASLPLALAWSGTAAAQTVIERNPPPVMQQAAPPPKTPTPPSAASQDSRPLGANLTTLRLIGPGEPLTSPPVGGGLAIGAIPYAPQVALQQELSSYLGKPLSRQLLSQIVESISKAYKRAGYPFVSVTTPPQEITSGVLQLRVIEFRSGGVRIAGGSPADQAAVAEQIDLPKGTRLNADAIDEDFDWANRYPYRSVRGVFAPGDAIGESQLALMLSPRRPFQLFGGYSNTGTHATDMNRIFLGAGLGIASLHDLTLTYQFTASPDFFGHPGRYDDGAQRPNYISHSGRVLLPLGYHMDIEFAPSYIASRDTETADLTFNTGVFDAPLVFRTAVSNIIPHAHLGDLTIGLEYVNETRTTYFDRIRAADGRANMLPILLGWSDGLRDKFGTTSIDVRVTINRSGLTPHGNDANWAVFTNGRVIDADFTLATFDLSRSMKLGKGFSWTGELNAVLSNKPLPDAEQIALGGMFGVRGYDLDDGNPDKGVFLRNELHAPAFSVLGELLNDAHIQDQLSPYLFVDYGRGHLYGYDNSAGPVLGRDYTLASAGFGATYQLGTHLQSNLLVGCALHDAAFTRTGDCHVQARVFLQY